MNCLDFRRRCFTQFASQFELESGSRHELPIKYEKVNFTDSDVMFYRYDICAIPVNRRPPKNFKGTLLTIETGELDPGFARLKSSHRLKTCYDTTPGGSVYLRRPHTYGYYRTTSPAVKDKNNLQAIARRGGNIKVFACAPGYPYSTDMNRVYAVYCPYWPLEVEEWRTRKRKYGWPDEALISRIARGGCHFVSKLRAESNFDDTEWRFSFSKAELILIHSWTEVQKSVYHFCRVIIRTMKASENDANEAFQTYFYKTLMLWACEESPREYWSESNIETCVLEILGRMVQCLIHRHCPGYFFPAHNLMMHLTGVDLTKEIGLLVYYIDNHVTKIIFSNLCIHSFQDKKHLKNIFPENLEHHVVNGHDVFLPDREFERATFDAINEVNPLNAELNGRLGQYLSECEWFLPEIKFLHAAIEANLRLMKIDSVSARRGSEHYTVFLRNMNRFFYGATSAQHELDCNLSHLENMNQILLREFRRIQSRKNERQFNGPRRGELESDDGSPYYEYSILTSCAKHREEQKLGSYFRPISAIIAAYNANFYFTTLKSYDITLEKCNEYLSLLSRSKFIWMFISATLSPIFDEHIRVILGFFLLHMATVSKNTSCCLEACLELCPVKFLEYVRIQCKRKLSGTSTEVSYTRQSAICPVTPGLSHLQGIGPFSDAVLFAALRQSEANIHWNE